MAEWGLAIVQTLFLCEIGFVYKFRFMFGELLSKRITDTFNDMRASLFPIWQTILFPSIIMIVGWLLWMPIAMYLLKDIITNSTPLDISYIITSVLLAPVAETLLLAGCINILIPTIQENLQKPVYVYSTIIPISLIFGVIHFKSTLIGFVTVSGLFFLQSVL